jgi:hypothetical protein
MNVTSIIDVISIRNVPSIRDVPSIIDVPLKIMAGARQTIGASRRRTVISPKTVVLAGFLAGGDDDKPGCGSKGDPPLEDSLVAAARADDVRDAVEEGGGVADEDGDDGDDVAVIVAVLMDRVLLTALESASLDSAATADVASVAGSEDDDTSTGTNTVRVADLVADETGGVLNLYRR